MKKYKFKSFKKKSGSLVAFSLKNSFPIKVKRIFLINGKRNFIRGDHAHKKCSQFVYPVLGKIKIYCETKAGKKIIFLKTYLLYSKPGIDTPSMLKNGLIICSAL